MFSLSVYNLDLYSFSKRLQPHLETLAKTSFLFLSFFPQDSLLQHGIWRPANFPLFSLGSDNFGTIALIP